MDQQIDSVTSGFLDGINVDFEAPILRNETDISKGFSALFEELYQRLKAKYNGYMVRIILAFYANLVKSIFNLKKKTKFHTSSPVLEEKH